MEEKEEKLDKKDQIKKDYKEVNKIIFLPNDDVPDDWTDFELTTEEFKILKEGEKYIEKELIPSLSTSKTIKPLESEKTSEKRNLETEKIIEDEEMAEIDRLLKEKSKEIKQEEKKLKKLSEKEKEEEKRKKELEELTREK